MPRCWFLTPSSRNIRCVGSRQLLVGTAGHEAFGDEAPPGFLDAQTEARRTPRRTSAATTRFLNASLGVAHIVSHQVARISESPGLRSAHEARSLRRSRLDLERPGWRLAYSCAHCPRRKAGCDECLMHRFTHCTLISIFGFGQHSGFTQLHPPILASRASHSASPAFARAQFIVRGPLSTTADAGVSIIRLPTSLRRHSRHVDQHGRVPGAPFAEFAQVTTTDVARASPPCGRRSGALGPPDAHVAVQSFRRCQHVSVGRFDGIVLCAGVPSVPPGLHTARRCSVHPPARPAIPTRSPGGSRTTVMTHTQTGGIRSPRRRPTQSATSAHSQHRRSRPRSSARRGPALSLPSTLMSAASGRRRSADRTGASGRTSSGRGTAQSCTWGTAFRGTRRIISAKWRARS